jgi:replicative DNA helicase
MKEPVVPTEPEPAFGGMPHNREAEEAILGAILINPELYFEVKGLLTGGAEAFYLHRLRFIWEAMTRLYEKKAPIDFLTVSEELARHGRLEEIGGPAYLTALLNQVPTTLHTPFYAKSVDDCYTRRRFLTAANTVATEAYNEEKPIEQVIANATGAIAGVIKQATRSRMTSGRDALLEMDAKNQARKNGEILGVPTGYVDLDNFFNGGSGIEGGKVICIAGRPGNGKSALLTGCAVYQILNGYHPAIFSMEMGSDEVAERMVAQASGLDTQVIRQAAFTDGELQLYHKALQDLGDHAEWNIDYTAGMTPEYIAAQCEILHARGMLSAVYIDQLDKLRTTRRFTKPVESYDYFMNTLKVEIAMRFNVPVFVAAQMNRKAEQEGNRRPRLSDLNEGGEKDADVVMFIWKDDTVPNVRHLLLEKHRGGPTGIVDLIWRGNCVRFENAIRKKISRDV